MLYDGNDTAREIAFGNGARQRDDLRDVRPVRTVADDFMRAFDGEIGDRSAVHRDAVGTKLIGRQSRNGKRRFLRFFRVIRVEFGKGCRRRESPRDRRLQALDAAALLIGQDQKIVAADGLVNVVKDTRKLASVEDVAAEQDHSGWLDVAIEAALVVRHRDAGKADD
jgi:hypothetical protein